jgi:hypothetical protein
MPGNSMRVSTKQQRIAELARRSPPMGFSSLAYLMDIDWLQAAFHRTRKDGAPGVDGQTWAEYAKNLEGNISYPDAGSPQGGVVPVCSSSSVAEVACPSQPPPGDDLGSIQRAAGALSASAAANCPLVRQVANPWPEEPYALMRASTDPWEPWAGNRPGPPGRELCRCVSLRETRGEALVSRCLRAVS